MSNSRKRPMEPSMDMVRRMGELDPQRLASEVQRLRRERDALRDSLAMKLSAYIATMTLREEDVLLVRKHARLDPKTAGEALEGLAKRLRQRYGWEGAIILLDGHDTVRAVVPNDVERVIAQLRAAEGVPDVGADA